MTQNTRAERLRQLIMAEDESRLLLDNAVIASNLLPLTTGAIKVFLERLHAHETRIGPYHTACYMCQTADLMIQEFS
jgi:hypothetical protein